MEAYLRIVRWKNLLFILVIQWLMQHAVVYPLLQTYGFEISQRDVFNILLYAATMLISAGGYVINDYFDVKIDRLNRPEKVIVSEKITPKAAMLYYQTLTVTGVICGLILAFLSHSFTLGFIMLFTPGLLWFYSASYKRQFITGNVIVSFSASLVMLVVGFLEVALLQIQYGNLLLQTPIPAQIYGWTGGFAAFAFACTWIREIIKDMEDIHGDREMECRTMPIKWGIPKTKYFLYALIILTIAALFHVDFHYIHFDGNLTTRYILFGLTLPLVALSYLIFRSKTPEDFHQASTLSKFIMLAGVLYSLIFYYLTAKTFHISIFGLFIVK